MAGLDLTSSGTMETASEVLRSLIETKDLDGIVQYIHNGGSVNGIYNVPREETPLFTAIRESGEVKRRCFCNDSSVNVEITREDEIVLLLINAGADVNARTHDGCTPLMEALDWRCSNEIIIELLNSGSDVSAKCNLNRSPLMLAIINDYDKELIYNLIKRGANVNHVTLNGTTPFFYALRRVDRYEIVKMILDAGANVNNAGNCWRMMISVADCGRTCEEGDCENRNLIDLLVNKGLDLTIRSTDAYTTVIHEVQCNYLISLAIKCGVSVNSKDIVGETPLMYALKLKYFDKIKSLLIKFNANPNNVNTETPLHFTVWCGCSKTSELVLYHASDIFAKDIYSKTSLDLLFGDFVSRIDYFINGDVERGISFMKHYLLYVDENNLYDYLKKEVSKVCKEDFDTVFEFGRMKLELSNMKQMFVKDGLTFYEFCRLKRYYKSKTIDMSFDELNYNFDQIKKMFPNYYDFITIRIKDNIIKNNRKHLLKSLEGIIIRPLPIIDDNELYLIYDCMRLIARNLNRKQLVTLFEASIDD